MQALLLSIQVAVLVLVSTKEHWEMAKKLYQQLTEISRAEWAIPVLMFILARLQLPLPALSPAL
jgi:hypothetical protein